MSSNIICQIWQLDHWLYFCQDATLLGLHASSFKFKSCLFLCSHWPHVSHRLKLAYIDCWIYMLTSCQPALSQLVPPRFIHVLRPCPGVDISRPASFPAPERATMVTLCLILRLPAESAQAAREIELTFSQHGKNVQHHLLDQKVLLVDFSTFWQKSRWCNNETF